MNKYRSAIISLLAIGIHSATLAADLVQDTSIVNATLIAELSPNGQKISALALEYEDNLISGSHLAPIFEINTLLDQQETGKRSVLNTYSNNKAAKSASPQAGKFLILELDVQDANANLYQLQIENEAAQTFRARDKQGNIVNVEKVQANRVPQYYGERLVYRIRQNGHLKLLNGKTVGKNHIETTAAQVLMPYVQDFTPHHISAADNPDNRLHYRLYQPQQVGEKTYPLTVFLHGSGQLGKDNTAQLLSSKGAIATLQQEQGFVLAPQYASVFDPFDDASKGQTGGIHWQTQNRLALLLKMIDETIAAHPNIDKNRIYLIGLSRGAEGALKLLQQRPDFFAAALLLSGREANTIEWIDGQADAESLEPVKHIPMWFFHSKEDKTAPVEGTRINVAILRELKAPFLRYTEFSTMQAGDNGILSKNPHNTWESVFDSPEVIHWLLTQKREQ